MQADDEAEERADEGAQDRPPPDSDAPEPDIAEPPQPEPEPPAWVDVPGTIRTTMMEGDENAPLFGFHLEGGAVGKDGVQIGFLSQFLDAFRKVFEPLQVLSTGRIPEGNNLPKTESAPPLVRSLEATASVTIFFSLNPIELALAETEAKKRDEKAELDALLTVQATGHLGALLDVAPGESLIDSVGPFGRRIGRSYGQLAKVLGDYEVETDWWSDLHGQGEIEISAPRAKTLADELLNKSLADKRTFELTGLMWEAATGASGKRFIRIDGPARAIKASYDIPLTTKVREALSHKVTVSLRETAYYQPYADKPEHREWELLKIVKIGDSAGALAEAEQLELGGN